MRPGILGANGNEPDSIRRDFPSRHKTRSNSDQGTDISEPDRRSIVRAFVFCSAMLLRPSLHSESASRKSHPELGSEDLRRRFVVFCPLFFPGLDSINLASPSLPASE